MNNIYLSLGSNKGDRAKYLQSAIELLAAHVGPVSKRSAIYETAAWGLTDQSDFLNMVVFMQTALSPDGLLAAIHNIELILGRQRSIKWGSRTIDIDILFYNDLILQSPSLTIPHALLQERRFVLIPLAVIAPSFLHPRLHKTVSELLDTCPDRSPVSIYQENKF